MNLKFRTLALICLPMLMHWEAIAADPQSDEITVSSEYVFHVPSSMPENEAKATALTRAKLQAIEEHFGSTVIQNNSTTINFVNCLCGFFNFFPVFFSFCFLKMFCSF